MTRRTITESVCRFGEDGRLVGILTRPDGAVPRRAFVLVTAGLTPKFGPFRLYVQLARRLASEGLLVLRFDLGGIGDSGQDRAGRALETRTPLEIRAAVDHLFDRFALDGVVLGGLCSGAEDAARFAEKDPRVSALMLMDAFAYRTPGWRRRDLLIRLLRRALRLAGQLPTYSAGADAKALIDYRHMPLSESGRILRTLVRRSVPVHFIYTGGMRESFNHEGQFKTMFGDLDFKGLASLDWFPLLRHTQELEHERAEVIDAIARRFGAESPA